MKKYFFVIILIAGAISCSGGGSSKDKNKLVRVENRKDTVPDLTRMLTMTDGLGKRIEQRYVGVFTLSERDSMRYELMLCYQQHSGDGVFCLATTYLGADQGNDKVFYTLGKRHTLRGITGDPDAVVYQLTPDNDAPPLYFLKKEERLKLLDKDQQPILSDKNYTLTLQK